MAKFVRMLVAAGITAAAVAVYAGVAVGHGDAGSHSKKGHANGRNLLQQSLAPSLPTDPTLHGVAPGGLPWVLKSGLVRFRANGKFEVRLRGLVIPVAPGNGTPGPVKTVSASLYCGADSDTTAIDTTAAVPLSVKGNARIRDRSFTVPSSCLAPVVLVHPNGDATHYIAVNGWR
jgi:hypothetical protein